MCAAFAAYLEMYTGVREIMIEQQIALGLVMLAFTGMLLYAAIVIK